MITAKIIADSIGPGGVRITTFELMYPRFIHAELMTHRALSKCSASSRAIPIETMLRRIEANPARPEFWAANQKGMQAVAEVDDLFGAQLLWQAAMLDAVAHSRKMADAGMHKAIANRVTEPYQHMTVVVTATDWANFFHLRYHPAAQQEFQILARIMYGLYMTHEPRVLKFGEWHLPYVTVEDEIEVMNELWVREASNNEPHQIVNPGWHIHESVEILKKISTGRCARTSYVNQDGVRALKDDVGLYDRLLQGLEVGDPGHMSPFEHQAMAWDDGFYQSGNFRGWQQHRKTIKGETTTMMPVLPVVHV
jgi:thymidylate synthase ThyX